MNMHKIWMIFLSLCFIETLIPQNNKQIMLSGSIQYPKSVTTVPMLHIIYQGRIITTELEKGNRLPKKGFYEIYEKKEPTEMYILITEYLKQPSSNTVQYLEISPQHPYKFFKIIKKQIISDPANPTAFECLEGWDIQELPNTEKNAIIPLNTIIIFMDPNFIKTLDACTWKPNDTIIKLPKIIFDDTISQELFNDTAARMAFAVLDFRFLVKPATKASRTLAQNRVASLPNPRSRYCS